MAADPAPYNAEHDEPWPGGRSNHYLFDMNRDWFAQSQPETRGRIKIGLEYLAANHRRSARAGRRQRLLLRAAGGADQSARHQEPDRRLGSVRPRQCRALRRARLGRTTSARSTTRSIRATAIRWPTFQGSIGMTYEQASARGLAFARSDGDDADLSRRRDAPLQRRHRHRHHRGAAIASGWCATISSTGAARSPKARRARSASTCSCPDRIRRAPIALARNLATQGIEVRRAEEPIKLGGAHDSRRRLPRLERAADRAHDPQPARSEDRAVGGVHQAAGRAPQDAAATIRSTTSPRGTCRCCSTWSW